MTNTKNVKRGEIYWAKDVPTASGYTETTVYKNRPVLVYASQASLKKSGVSTVIPLTSNVTKLGAVPSHVLIDTATLKPSVLMPEQICTVPTLALTVKVAKVDDHTMTVIDTAVSKQLGIS